MAIIQKNTGGVEITSVDQNVENLEPSCPALENVKGADTIQNSLAFSQEVKQNYQQFHSEEYVLRNWKQGLKDILSTSAQSNVIHSSQNLETTKVCVYGWVNKQNVVKTSNGLLLSHKKKGNSDTCYHTDESRRHYAKWNKPDTEG